MKKKPINPLTSFYSNMSVNGFSISLFFLYNFKLGSSNSSSAESIVTRSSWRRRRASLFISSHSFHRCRQTLFLLFCFVSFYLFFSTLFTTERCVSSVLTQTFEIIRHKLYRSYTILNPQGKSELGFLLLLTKISKLY
jgi:hypothetical protein